MPSPSAVDLASQAIAPVRLSLRGQVLTPTSEERGLRYLSDGVVELDAGGRIAHVGRARDAPRGALLRDVRPGVILPGFVDAHVHFPQTRIVGRATGPLLAWLASSVFPEEARFRRRAYARAVAEEMAARLVAAGTTTAGIFSSSSPVATDVLFEQLAESGLRAVAGLVLMDRDCPPALQVPTARAIAACRRLARRWHGYDDGRLGFAVTPRFAPSCSRELLEAAGALAQELDLVVQTHVSETRDEAEHALRAHPYARGYLDIYDRAGLLGPRTVLAHAIHLSAAEWRRLGAAGGTVAHCPDSNFFLGSGRMPLSRAERHGVVVGLGSDVAAGRSFSLRRAMASAYDNAMCLGEPIAPAALLRMATLGGAEALGLGTRVGSLEPGKEADVVVLGLPPHVEGRDAALAHVCFADDQHDARGVYVRGRRLDRPTAMDG